MRATKFQNAIKFVVQVLKGPKVLNRVAKSRASTVLSRSAATSGGESAFNDSSTSSEESFVIVNNEKKKKKSFEPQNERSDSSGSEATWFIQHLVNLPSPSEREIHSIFDGTPFSGLDEDLQRPGSSFEFHGPLVNLTASHYFGKAIHDPPPANSRSSKSYRPKVQLPHPEKYSPPKAKDGKMRFEYTTAHNDAQLLRIEETTENSEDTHKSSHRISTTKGKYSRRT